VATIGALIAQGRQAEVYASDAGAVVKLYRDGFDGHAAEAAALVRLDGTGVAPSLLDTLSVDGRVGLVLQRLDGVDMLTLLERRPWRLRQLATMLAHAALRVHREQAPPDLPDLADRLRVAIGSAELQPHLRAYALSVLSGLPVGDRLCHGDLHPGNAMVTADGASIIDWPGATRGVPAADFARTMLLLRGADPLPGTSGTLLAVGRRMFSRVFARAYRKGVNSPLSDVGKWTVVHVAARLAEGITSERVRLINMLEAAYRRA
jgi:hypothetical protein